MTASKSRAMNAINTLTIIPQKYFSCKFKKNKSDREGELDVVLCGVLVGGEHVNCNVAVPLY